MVDPTSLLVPFSFLLSLHLIPLESASLSFPPLFPQAYFTESNSILNEFQNILSLSVGTVYKAEMEPDCLA